MSFNLSELSISVNYTTIEHVLRANKALKKNAKIKSITLNFPGIEKLSQCKLIVYSNASCNNLENGGSQGGFAYFYEIFMEFYP